MSLFIPIMFLAIIAIAAGAFATYYYTKARALQLALDQALESCAHSIEHMYKRYAELAEHTARQDVISREEADKMMAGIKEIMDSTEIIKNRKI